MWRRFELARLTVHGPVTHGGIIGQVWRGGARQARLAVALDGLEIRSIDEALGRRVGELLALARTTDVIDAALVLLAEDGDQIATSDPDDIAHLARAADLEVDIIVV